MACMLISYVGGLLYTVLLHVIICTPVLSRTYLQTYLDAYFLFSSYRGPGLRILYVHTYVQALHIPSLCLCPQGRIRAEQELRRLQLHVADVMGTMPARAPKQTRDTGAREGVAAGTAAAAAAADSAGPEGDEHSGSVNGHGCIGRNMLP